MTDRLPNQAESFQSISPESLADPSHDERGERKRTRIHLLLLALLVAIVFSNTLQNGLYLDDAYRIDGNPGIESFWPPWRHFFDNRTNSSLPQIAEFRPMLPLTLSVDVLVSKHLGLNRLAVHHVVNICIQLANSILLYYLFRALLLASRWSTDPRQRLDIAFCAALFFSIHPISGVPINYVGARDLQMMFLFLLSALLVYARMRRGGDGLMPWLAALGLLTLGLGSKQNAAVAPALIFAYDFFITGSRLRSWRTWVRPLPFAAVVAGFLAWSRWIVDMVQIKPGSVVEPLVYLATQFRLHVFYYLRNVVWPFEMRLLADVGRSESLLEPAVMIGVALFVCSIALALLLRKSAPAASWCIAAYWILFSPSSLIPFRQMTYFVTDYRQYPSYAFLCLLLALLLARFVERRLATLAAVLLALHFGTAAYGMNRNWRSEESVWGQSVRYGARSMAEMNYGMAVAGRDRELAEKHYRRALEKAPNNTYAHINLGLLYLRTGKTEKGLEAVKLGVANAPTWGLTHYWLGYAYDLAGEEEEARRERRVAADLDTRNLGFQLEAARDLQKQDEYEASLPYLERIANHGPIYGDSTFYHALALQQVGRWAEAETKYRLFLESRPRHHLSWFNLGHGLTQADRCDEAIEAFQQVVALGAGRVGPAHQWLAVCYSRIGNDDAAARHRALASAEAAEASDAG